MLPGSYEEDEEKEKEVKAEAEEEVKEEKAQEEIGERQGQGQDKSEYSGSKETKTRMGSVGRLRGGGLNDGVEDEEWEQEDGSGGGGGTQVGEGEKPAQYEGQQAMDMEMSQPLVDSDDEQHVTVKETSFSEHITSTGASEGYSLVIFLNSVPNTLYSLYSVPNTLYFL